MLCGLLLQRVAASGFILAFLLLGSVDRCALESKSSQGEQAINALIV